MVEAAVTEELVEIGEDKVLAVVTEQEEPEVVMKGVAVVEIPALTFIHGCCNWSRKSV